MHFGEWIEVASKLLLPGSADQITSARSYRMLGTLRISTPSK